MGVADLLAAEEALERAGLLIEREDGRDVESFRVGDAARDVGDGDHPRARLVAHARGDRADVAEALDDDPGAGQREACQRRGLAADEHQAATRGLDTPARPPEREGLAGDDGGHGVPRVHRVRVHDPGHRLRIGAHVRRLNVLLGPELVHQLGGVAARDPFQLSTGKHGRVADDAPLGAAEGDVDDRALPCHPRREGPNLVERHVLVEADAPFAGPACDVVEDTVADEDLDPAVVHGDRDRNLGLAHGLAQHLVEARIEAELLRGHIEPRHHLLERVGRVHARGRSTDRDELGFGDLVQRVSLRGPPAGTMGAGIVA